MFQVELNTGYYWNEKSDLVLGRNQCLLTSPSTLNIILHEFVLSFIMGPVGRGVKHHITVTLSFAPLCQSLYFTQTGKANFLQESNRFYPEHLSLQRTLLMKNYALLKDYAKYLLGLLQDLCKLRWFWFIKHNHLTFSSISIIHLQSKTLVSILILNLYL